MRGEREIKTKRNEETRRKAERCKEKQSQNNICRKYRDRSTNNTVKNRRERI